MKPPRMTRSTLPARPKPDKSKSNRRSQAPQGAWSPVDAQPDRPDQPERRPPSDRPLWLFLTEPGLSDLALKELKARKVVGRKTRATKLFLRNYDMLVVPDAQVTGDPRASRLILHALVAPVFGRGAVTDGQLDRLAGAWGREKADGLVSSIAGSHFVRQDLTRWLAKRLRDRGVEAEVDGKAARPAWLLVVDQAFYVGFARANHHDAPGRTHDEDRTGALPATVSAAMVFAANPQPGEVIWDPTAGSGTLLNEAAEMTTDAALIGTDLDPQAVALAQRRLGRRASLQVGDATTLDLDRQDVTLTLANLPWGKRYEAEGGNAAMYEAVIRNSLTHAAPNWRGLFITSDGDALRKALRGIGGLIAESLATVKVRGIEAGLWRVSRVQRT